jgi:hypothetical protein
MAKQQDAVLRDRRSNPVYIDSRVDDMSLSSDAFRVYCHLVRRAGRDGCAFPSHQSIGDVCFGADSPSAAWRERLSIRAVKELLARGMIARKLRARRSTLYEITPLEEWI